MAGKKDRQRQTCERRQNSRKRSRECKLMQNLRAGGNRGRGKKIEREKRLTRGGIFRWERNERGASKGVAQRLREKESRKDGRTVYA